MILFFEAYSIIQTLFLFRYIRKARLIYFHKRGVPRSDFAPGVKRRVERLIHLINKRVEIKTIPTEKVYQYNWELNKEAVGLVEELTSDIQQSSVYRMVLKIIRDANILKFYQQRLATDIPDRWLFMKVAKALSSEHDSLVIIPKSNDNSFLEIKLFGNEELGKYSISVTRRANNLRFFFRKVGALAILLLLPLGFVILRTRITLSRINRESYDVAMPVIWGFHGDEDKAKIRGVRRPHNDEYLYNEEIIRGHIIHIFGDWRDTDVVDNNYKRIMNKKGIPYIDRRDYKANINFLLTAGRIQLKILTGLWQNSLCWRSPLDYIDYSIGAINCMLRKYLEFENIGYKVELMRHDYSAAHIVETILCNQQGKKTVGIQHRVTAGPNVMNSLCYVHMDKYCIFSDAHLRLYSPYWEKLDLAKTGAMDIDWTINLVDNGKLMVNNLKQKMHSLYKVRKYTVLIAFPGPSGYNQQSKWAEMYDALREFKSLDTDCNVFLRFRTIDDLSAPHMVRFADLPKRDERIIIDLTNFTTYELMALCDLYITSSHSSGLIEAVAIGKKAFTFDYMGTTQYCFSNYGKDLILTIKDDVLALFKDLENNFAGYDCNWELLRKEYNYYYDGRCSERQQRVVCETVKEVSQGKT